MEKNQLKMYDAPIVESIEMEVAQFLCASGGGTPWDPSDDAEER